MSTRKPTATRDQVLAPVILILIGLVIVGGIGYLGRSARRSVREATHSTPPSAPRVAEPSPAPRSVAETPSSAIVLEIADAPSRGAKEAPVVLVEFSDYQCPFCARHVRETMPEIEREYVRTRKVRYVFRDFPLEAIHPHAFRAAEAARCAGEQGRFWEMHDRLFAHQNALTSKDLLAHAEALGLNLRRFRRCLEERRFAERIRRDLSEGQRAGVRGTPSFFLGVPESGGKVRVLRVLRGAQPYEAFRQAVEELLREGRSS
ncbi:Disulfide bond formation protein D [bacterium HR08]|nr:Disulfide bond formation protein D [bacterium HR08]